MEQQPVTYAQADHGRTNRLKLIWGLVCLIGPTALLIVALLVYAIANFIAAGTTSGSGGDDLFGEPSPGETIANVVMFLVGTVSVLTWLPGIIVGIILLATRK